MLPRLSRGSFKGGVYKIRDFPYITLGKILETINSKVTKPFLKRPTYYRLEKSLGLPKGKRTTSKT